MKINLDFEKVSKVIIKENPIDKSLINSSWLSKLRSKAGIRLARSN